MKSKSLVLAFRLLGIAAVFLAVSSCSKSLQHLTVMNELPTVRITAAPIDTTVVCNPDPIRSCYSLTLYWVGVDPDGRVDHYLYAVDPPSPTPAVAHPETTWHQTANNTERLLFTSSQNIPREAPRDYPIWIPRARDFHIFVIKAVDNAGQAGPSVARAFFSFTQAPDVYVSNPLPSSISTPLLTPSVRISWTGSDEDGVFNTKPVKYKYILLTQSTPFPFAVDSAVQNPDRLRDKYAPNFAGWDSVSGDTTTVQYTNLAPNQEYVFVVVAFDEAGAYSPIFTLNHNMLRFRVGFAGALGSSITAFNEFFNYTFRPGYCPTCPSSITFIEVPAGKLVNINWTAEPPVGADMRSYRWCLDSDNLADETPRIDDNNPAYFNHWSSRSLNNTGVVLGPYAGTIPPDPPEEHRLYIEAEDNVGFRSLGIIRFQVVRANHRPGKILVVKDTRLKPESVNRTTGCVNDNPPTPWPTQAELDTFLFARGNTPWLCLPAGTITPRGLFAKYGRVGPIGSGADIDTIGTRIRQKDLTVRLSILSQYEFVVWMVDKNGANFSEDGTSFSEPMPALRFMNGPGKFNTFAAFIKEGGRAWLLGGGGGTATNIDDNWNDRSNDVPTITFSARATRPELKPGRFMYDIARWQSEYRISAEPVPVRRYLGRYENVLPASRPSYLQNLSAMPTILEFRVPATDPMPPNRSNTGRYYPQVSGLEYLQVENIIQENTSPDPEHPNEVATLDTLYKVSGGGLPPPIQNPHNVVMTYYHGPGVPQGFIFTGFDVWSWKRTQCQDFVDFVMQQMWGRPTTPAPSFVGRPLESSAPPVARVDARAPVGSPSTSPGARRSILKTPPQPAPARRN